MKADRVDHMLDDWSVERPELATDALGIVLRIQMLEKRLGEELDDCLAKLDLEWWEYDVLSSLRRQGAPFRATASEIADDSMLSPGALTNRIDRLMARGFVARTEDPGDRRRVIVSLTEVGLEVVDSATKARFSCANGAIDCLTFNQRGQLDHLLKKMLSGLE